jgi:hypothetical protein
MIALTTDNWDGFYRHWIVPIEQLLIPMAIALAVLFTLTGLLTRVMVRPGATAWSGPACSLWKAIGGVALLAAAAFLSVYPTFHPFTDGRWVTWVFLFAVVVPGVTLVVLGSSVHTRFGHRATDDRPVMPERTLWILPLIWAGLLAGFFAADATRQLLIAHAALAVLGVTASATAFGQNLRLQVEAQGADGTADAAASEYVLARLQSLGSKGTDSLGIARANELSSLLSQNLSAIPAGAITAAMARIMYAVRPDLTWRARLTVVDVNRVTVTLTRNMLPVSSTVISRLDLGLPLLDPGTGTGPPPPEDPSASARAQVLTGAAACILVRLSRVHPELRTGLCGATRWKSVALHVIAGERAWTEQPQSRLALLKAAVDLDPGYGLCRLDYLNELFSRSCRTPDRMRFARLMDAQLRLSEGEGHSSRKGWESIRLRILYSQAEIRTRVYLAAAARGEGPPGEPDAIGEDVLRKARNAASRLVAECRTISADGRQEPELRHFAKQMEPKARTVRSIIAFLTDEAERSRTGGKRTWTPPAPTRCPSPGLALDYAALAGLLDVHDVSRGRLGDTLDYLTLAVTSDQERQAVRQDPAFWEFLRDPARAPALADAVGLRPVGMLDLPPFRPYVTALTAVGVTSFAQLRRRTADGDQQKTLSDYLNVSPLVVSHFLDIAELAAAAARLGTPEVLGVFLGAGIDSLGELLRRASEDRAELVRALRAEAGRTGLPGFGPPDDQWLTDLLAHLG